MDAREKEAQEKHNVNKYVIIARDIDGSIMYRTKAMTIKEVEKHCCNIDNPMHVKLLTVLEVARELKVIEMDDHSIKLQPKE